MRPVVPHPPNSVDSVRRRARSRRAGILTEGIDVWEAVAHLSHGLDDDERRRRIAS